MELSEAWSTVPMAIWGLCSAFLLFVLLSAAIQHRTIELFRSGLFISVLAWVILITINVYHLHFDVPNPLETSPVMLLVLTIMGAAGSLMIVRDLLR
jgi:hypothetical protein